MELDNDTTKLLKAINDMKRGELILISSGDLINLKKVIEMQKEENDKLLDKVNGLTKRNNLLSTTLKLDRLNEKIKSLEKLQSKHPSLI